MSLSIAVEPPRSHQVEELLRLGDEFTRALYPPESCYLLNVSELEQPGISVYVARDAADRALGMAALVSRGNGSAELKRMFVRDDARGQGLAGRLLDRIEMDAATSGIQHIELETGPLQYAALALYERRGYARVPNFGPYVGDEFSVCFAKELLTHK
jgi:putative acetyltransferase